MVSNKMHNSKSVGHFKEYKFCTRNYGTMTTSYCTPTNCVFIYKNNEKYLFGEHPIFNHGVN